MPPSSSSHASAENSIRSLLKPWKNLLSHPASFSVVNANFMRGFLIVLTFATFSLCYFTFLPEYKWRSNCPECDQISVRSLHNQLTGSRRRDEKTEISHIMFGIGGSAETWRRRRHYSELWWKPNITRGFVWLDKSPEDGGDTWPAKSPPYRVSGDTARFKYTNWEGSRSAVRLARIVKESFELGSENVRWFVMGDDDTVFFTENLVNLLNKYDHKQMYYIGGNSESVEQDVFHSYAMAYGGGGFAVSYPLAAELVKILDGCVYRYAGFYGSDLKVGACVNELGIPFTREPGFHQMDIRGSPFGLLAAHPVEPLISLHHLDYVQPLFPGSTRVESVKKLIRAYTTDPSRILQQSFCYDPARNWSTSVSWGYSVQLYPFFVTPKDLSTPLQTFLTWGTWSQQPFTFNTRVISFDPCERPNLFYFDRVKGSGYGSTTTFYKRPGANPKKPCREVSYVDAYSVKGFNVSAAFLDPGIWNKSPRRQCCEIINGSDEVDGVVQVRIRGCSQWETATPQIKLHPKQN